MWSHPHTSTNPSPRPPKIHWLPVGADNPYSSLTDGEDSVQAFLDAIEAQFNDTKVADLKHGDIVAGLDSDDNLVTLKIVRTVEGDPYTPDKYDQTPAP
jgi:hypothetical protein